MSGGVPAPEYFMQSPYESVPLHTEGLDGVYSRLVNIVCTGGAYGSSEPSKAQPGMDTIVHMEHITGLPVTIESEHIRWRQGVDGVERFHIEYPSLDGVDSNDITRVTIRGANDDNPYTFSAQRRINSSLPGSLPAIVSLSEQEQRSALAQALDYLALPQHFSRETASEVPIGGSFFLGALSRYQFQREEAATKLSDRKTAPDAETEAMAGLMEELLASNMLTVQDIPFDEPILLRPILVDEPERHFAQRPLQLAAVLLDRRRSRYTQDGILHASILFNRLDDEIADMHFALTIFYHTASKRATVSFSFFYDPRVLNHQSVALDAAARRKVYFEAGRQLFWDGMVVRDDGSEPDEPKAF